MYGILLHYSRLYTPYIFLGALDFPTQAWMKLNCDGASRGNPGFSGGGGVCRSSKGSILMAYYEYYGVYSSLVAETRAVLSGRKLLGNSFLAIWLDLDSLVLVQILSDEINCPWQIYY